MEGYRSVMKRIYSCEAYYERVKLYLSRATQAGKRAAESGRRVSQALADPCQLRAPSSLRSSARESSAGSAGATGSFLLTVATRYRRCFGAAMTLAVMGYHFQVMTQKLSKAIDSAKQPAESGEILLGETGRPIL